MTHFVSPLEVKLFSFFRAVLLAEYVALLIMCAEICDEAGSS